MGQLSALESAELDNKWVIDENGWKIHTYLDGCTLRIPPDAIVQEALNHALGHDDNTGVIIGGFGVESQRQTRRVQARGH